MTTKDQRSKTRDEVKADKAYAAGATLKECAKIAPLYDPYSGGPKQKRKRYKQTFTLTENIPGFGEIKTWYTFQSHINSTEAKNLRVCIKKHHKISGSILLGKFREVLADLRSKK